MTTQTAEKFELTSPPPKPPKPKPITAAEKRRIKESTPTPPTRQESEWLRSCQVERGIYDPTMSHFAAPITEDEAWFRHHNWKHKRELVLQTLHATGQTIQAVENFRNCGSECTVEWSPSEKQYRIRGSFCKSRHCEPCARAKGALIIANMRAIFKDRDHTRKRFITLTLKHSDAPLVDQIKHLYKSYTKLRASKTWKRTQKGGAAMLEVKWQDPLKMYARKNSPDRPGDGKWHPHLHIISEGTYLDTYALSDAWLAASGDSSIVDIRQISADKDVAYYVAKYVTKGTVDEVWTNPSVAQEWIIASKGVRTCATFGTWRGMKLLAKPKDAGDWQPVATLTSLVKRAQRGEVAALELLKTLTESKQYNPNRKRRGSTQPPAD